MFGQFAVTPKAKGILSQLRLSNQLGSLELNANEPQLEMDGYPSRLLQEGLDDEEFIFFGFPLDFKFDEE